MLRHLPVPRLAHRTITIRVDYLVRVISLLLLIGLLTSCVPEEDAVEGSGDDYLRIGDKQILWGQTTSKDVTFSKQFSEPPTVITSTKESSVNGCCFNFPVLNIQTNSFSLVYTPNGGTVVHWQAIGKYK